MMIKYRMTERSKEFPRRLSSSYSLLNWSIIMCGAPFVCKEEE